MASEQNSILLSLDTIQQQVEHCEKIVNNIDKLVPNLYKIRQQVLAQKNYILDIQQSLSSNNGTINNNNRLYSQTEPSAKVDNSVERAPGFKLNGAANDPADGAYPPVLTVTLGAKLKNKDNVEITKNSINNTANLRNVVQSLYKFKHDQGTSVHFTSHQISTDTTTRIRGLNLSDIESITDGLNDYLSISATTNNTTTGHNDANKTKVNNSVRKLFAPANITDESLSAAANILDDNSNAGDIVSNKIDIFKAIIDNTTHKTKTIKIDTREVKSRRIDISESNSKLEVDTNKVVTFGLD